MEGSLVAYKVFTNGSVLNASEINDNLMNQSVMVFSNATARSAALTSPIEGMLTWLEDVNRYENYNGTAWVELGSAPGSVLLSTTSFTAASSVSPGSGTFSSTYDSYTVIFHASVSAQLSLQYRLGNGVTPNTSASYVSAVFGWGITGNANNIPISNAGQTIGTIAHGNSQISVALTVVNPFASTNTSLLGNGFGSSSDSVQFASFFIGSRFTANTSFDNIFFTPSTGNLTGTLSVYGMRK
jgi:hypothetical protein